MAVDEVRGGVELRSGLVSVLVLGVFLGGRADAGIRNGERCYDENDACLKS